MKTDFTLIDLASQADEFWRYVKGWQTNQILEWLQAHGTLIPISHPMDTRLFVFRSVAGLETGFRLAEDGQLVILLEHTTYVPKDSSFK